MPTDDELILDILKGNQASMEVLVNRYYKSIFAYIYRKTGDYHKAYDLTQEVFIKMIKGLKKYKRKGSFKSWLFTIANNHCTDYFKSSNYKYESNVFELDENITDENSNVSDIFSKNLERKQIKEAILSLPEYQRDTIILKYYHNFKIKDIAKITNTKEATVKSRLKQGLDKLKKWLIGGEFDEISKK